jgi:hypothetical protein
MSVAPPIEEGTREIDGLPSGSHRQIEVHNRVEAARS